MTNWLAGRETAFPQWRSDYAGSDDGPWDFSAESLDGLEALTRRVLPSKADVATPAITTSSSARPGISAR
ncbi:MAG: hypothetical protein M3492_03455 [Actinomycetota bacterium]|nr:hypothetical protein [Actinomycetota bacterium]